MTRDDRSRRALKTGAITAGIVLVLLWLLLFLASYLGYTKPVTEADAYQRGYDEVMGPAKFSAFCGLLAVCISYAASAIRNRTAPKPISPPPPNLPGSFSPPDRPDPAQALFEVQDDSD